MKIPRIGRGKKFSIAKAALIFYFEDKENAGRDLNWGDLNAMNGIVDIAGAEHASFFTPTQVIACLRNSPYWDCTCCFGFYAGISNGKASVCSPSQRGIDYYNKQLKNRKK